MVLLLMFFWNFHKGRLLNTKIFSSTCLRINGKWLSFDYSFGRLLEIEFGGVSMALDLEYALDVSGIW